jgi:hypothetical protein
MGIDKRRVHILKEVQTRSMGKVTIIDKVNPYIRFCSEEGPRILACDGKLYFEDESPVADKDIPKWFWGRWDALTPEGKAKVGGDRIELLRSGKSAPDEIGMESADAAPDPVAPIKKKKAGKRSQPRRRISASSREAGESNVDNGVTS